MDHEITQQIRDELYGWAESHTGELPAKVERLIAAFDVLWNQREQFRVILQRVAKEGCRSEFTQMCPERCWFEARKEHWCVACQAQEALR
jgi:hypothetical protein